MTWAALVYATNATVSYVYFGITCPVAAVFIVHGSLNVMEYFA